MTVSRRAFLLGGLGVATAGIGVTGMAGVTHRGRRLLHALGLLDGDDNPAPGGASRVVYDAFDSKLLRRSVRFAVATPPDIEGPVPVVYALHGRGEDETFAVASIRFQQFLAAADVPAAVVSVDGGPSSYWHPRRDGTDALGMLVRELVPRIEERIGNGRRGLLGWSMGGFGALLAAERYPDLFPVVAAASPALWRSPDATAPGAFDGALDFKAHDVFTATDRLDGVTLRLDCGRDDPFRQAIEAFAALVPKATFHVRHGFHDAAYWRSIAPQQAAFFGKYLVAGH